MKKRKTFMILSIMLILTLLLSSTVAMSHENIQSHNIGLQELSNEPQPSAGIHFLPAIYMGDRKFPDIPPGMSNPRVVRSLANVRLIIYVDGVKTYDVVSREDASTRSFRTYRTGEFTWRVEAPPRVEIMPSEMRQDLGFTWANYSYGSFIINEGETRGREIRPLFIPVEIEPINLYRLYNPFTNRHLYTIDKNEYEHLGTIGWNQEGVAWVTPSVGIPVKRLFHPGIDAHHFTLDMNEYNHLVANGWNSEGTLFFSYEGETRVGKRRLFNPFDLRHLYTADLNEYNILQGLGWRSEGIGFYGKP